MCMKRNCIDLVKEVWQIKWGKNYAKGLTFLEVQFYELCCVYEFPIMRIKMEVLLDFN